MALSSSLTQLALSKPRRAGLEVAVDPEAVAMLASMGFAEKHVAFALKESARAGSKNVHVAVSARPPRGMGGRRG